MALTPISAVDCLARLDDFDAIIDARSEGEYALDHLPGALNWPSLNNEERVLVGTEYKQISPFVARKRGAALAARNVASHIERHVLDKPRDWQPLVYCWRGGQRSGSLALVLGQIGFRVQVVEGGYRAYRRAVMDELESLPERFQFRVLCGKTGSGKSRLLTALHTQGAQVLDLEGLANHRGSVLGLVPGHPQPSQKRFETLLWDVLRRLDAARQPPGPDFVVHWLGGSARCRQDGITGFSKGQGNAPKDKTRIQRVRHASRQGRAARIGKPPTKRCHRRGRRCLRCDSRRRRSASLRLTSP